MLIGYMRVSSETDRQNTNLQKDALIKEGVDPRHIYEDNMSGIRDDRPGLKNALEYLKEGDTLVVWKLDRLGRSLPHLLKIVTDLQKRKVAFKSITENMDSSTAHGEFIFNLFGSLAQYERSLAQERILAGLEAARKRGKVGGRPRKIDAEKLNTIIGLINSGASKAKIARNFDIPRSTLNDALKRSQAFQA
jgi:DNA invertase Pin-like site-specific DNA recombinase